MFTGPVAMEDAAHVLVCCNHANAVQTAGAHNETQLSLYVKIHIKYIN